jgi:Polyketide cyclase / dehydrase and lipid transport
MGQVYISTIIKAPVTDVWRVVRNFNGLADWTDFVSESRIENHEPADKVGCIRNFRLKDGGVIREQLLALSDYDLSMSYSILESQMALQNYIATLSLTPVTEGNLTFAEWEAEFDCAKQDEASLVQHIGQNVFTSAFASLKRRFGT